MAFLLRDRAPYKLPLPPAMETAIQALRAPTHNTTTLVDRLQELLFTCWTSSWKPSSDNSLGDPTHCYIALSSIRADFRWAHPKEITGPLAKLTYCMRLVALRKAHGESDVSSALDSLSPMFTEKIESSFNTIRSLQHLASSIAYATVSKPITFWAEDDGQYRTLIFAGAKIAMTDLRNMGRRVLLHTFDFMVNKVFLKHFIEIPSMFIYDDLTDDTPGYCFLTDPRNTSLIPYQKTLLRAILDEEDLRDEFIKGFHPGTGNPLWNLPRLRLWYRHYCELQLHFAILIQTLGGAPARATELLCLQYRNTPSQTRGLYKMHHNWVILCQYSKTSALTGQDKFIPHGLDAFAGNMLFHSLVCALPLAQMFAAVIFPQNVAVQKVLYTHLFPNGENVYDTDHLTSSLKLVSSDCLGVSLSTSQWRQFFVAVRRKHCPDFEDILDFESVDTVGALQAGHSRQTENRIYGLTPDSFTHHSEDVIKVFLEFTKKWATFMNIPPGHLPLSYQLLSSPSTYEPHLPVDDGTAPLPAQLRLNPAGQQLEAIHKTTTALDEKVSRKYFFRSIHKHLPLCFPPAQTLHLQTTLNQQSTILFSLAQVSIVF